MNTPQEFHALLEGFRHLQRTGFRHGAALATLTRTHGSTFRRPGARMLVFGDGTVLRGLSGGCPEADIIARAREVIEAKKPRIVRYNRETGLDALIELGCGGELEVLIEPLTQDSDLGFIDAVEKCIRSRRPGFLATAYARDGSCLNPRPARLVWSGTTLHNELGDSRLSTMLVEVAETLSNDGQPHVQNLELSESHIAVLVERLLPPFAIVAIGVNAASLALARLGCSLGWDVTVVDPRRDRARPEGLAGGARLLVAQPTELASQLPLDTRSFAVVMTHNLERDIEYLRALLTAPLAYLGAMGSRQRSRKLFDGSGAAPSQLRAPAGLDLGSETPEEIAVAIAAEILAVSTNRSGSPLSAGAGPIH